MILALCQSQQAGWLLSMEGQDETQKSSGFQEGPAVWLSGCEQRAGGIGRTVLGGFLKH